MRPRLGGRRSGQRGSAAVLATVLVGALVTVAMLVATVGGAVADQRRVESAADLGALAGAAAAQAGDDGCAAAAAMVARNRARLAACSAAAGILAVRAERETWPVLGLRFTVTSRARAGPTGSLLTWGGDLSTFPMVDRARGHRRPARGARSAPVEKHVEQAGGPGLVKRLVPVATLG